MDITGKRGIHFHLDAVQDIGGFALESGKQGDSIPVLTRATINSDEPEFYKYIEPLSNPLFNKVGVFRNAVYQFLILIHKDLSADLYINDFPVAIEIIFKRDMKMGEAVTQGDIADIRRLRFPNIEIVKTDKVICCFKVGWKFGLFFDLGRELDIDAMELDLGTAYRYLSFQYVYEVLENKTQSEEMIKDGWFPFIEIVGGEYKSLSEAYQNKFHFEERIDKIVGSFDKTRIEKITNRWWKKQIFEDKRGILQAGINAFLRGGNEGYINCINTLLPQVDGIIRLQYLSDTGKSVGVKKLLQHLREKGRIKSGSDSSLLLPSPFLKYLGDVVFAHFNLETGQVDLSRSSVGHGVAKAEAYTKIAALQAILVLDQIYFYI
ncbi:MAG: hypothetical protein J7K77_04515 [Dehalococcoidales bacterium]|nr:hypothetical protein [Dehalococcoidales bacterium]